MGAEIGPGILTARIRGRQKPLEALRVAGGSSGAPSCPAPDPRAPCATRSECRAIAPTASRRRRCVPESRRAPRVEPHGCLQRVVIASCVVSVRRGDRPATLRLRRPDASIRLGIRDPTTTPSGEPAAQSRVPESSGVLLDGGARSGLDAASENPGRDSAALRLARGAKHRFARRARGRGAVASTRSCSR